MEPAEKAGPTPQQLGGERGNGAGEQPTTGTLMGDACLRLARYGTAKAHTLRALESVTDEQAHRIGLRVGKIRQCGDWLVFRHFPTLQDTKLHSANFCSVHLACGFCAIRRGARMMAKYLERFQLVRAKHPELKPYLVTFTVLNGADLAERLAHLERSLTRLNKRRHGKRSRSMMRDVRGAVWSYEVTWSALNGWHPHVHAIWLCESEPDMYALRAEWEDVTGDSFMCDVRPIEPDEKAPADCDPHAKGFAEVFKYAMKAAELPTEQMLQAYEVMRGRRLVRSFGKFFGVVEPANGDLADELPESDLPYIDLLWRYRGDRYELAKTIDFTDHCPARGGGDAAGVPAGRTAVASCDLRRATGRTEQRLRTLRRQMAKQLAKSADDRIEAVLPAVP